jgi:molybdopterin-guanine dinucleotide biosynthesis protein A
LNTTLIVSADRPELIGVVLAGGRSSRMGRDKAQLTWNGRMLLDRQLDTLREAGVDRALVSGHRTGYDAVADIEPDRGPLGGLASIAASMEHEADLLVIPVDMPLVTPAALARLGRARPAARCLRYAARILPMRLRLDNASRDTLNELMHADTPRQRSLRELQRRMDVREMPLPPRGGEQFSDCNTRADWETIRA